MGLMLAVRTAEQINQLQQIQIKKTSQELQRNANTSADFVSMKTNKFFLFLIWNLLVDV